MYTASVYASGNHKTGTRTLYIETYSWPAMSAALAGVREDFAWRYGDAETGKPRQIREPQTGETLEFRVGTEAQFENTFTGLLVLTSDSR